MSHRGYCVIPELYEELCRELEALSIPYRTVETPEGLGDPVRPVLISNQAAPKGWARYRKCRRNGQHGHGLMSNGLVAPECKNCSSEWTPTSTSMWHILERGCLARELGLPNWIDQVGVVTVWDVRDKLKRNDLANVGPERAPIIAQALLDWREKTLELLKEGV